MTDLSFCKRPRAHFTDTEGLLLGVSAVHTKHPEWEEKQKYSEHQRADTSMPVPTQHQIQLFNKEQYCTHCPLC